MPILVCHCLANTNQYMTEKRLTLTQLPENFIMPLSGMTAIRLKGEEQQKYLQGQVTCDVNELQQNSMLHGAHCDAKGKVLSVFRLVEHQEALLLIQPLASLTLSLAELKKFGVFAKVDIEQADDLHFTAFVGNDNAQALNAEFNALPDAAVPVIQDKENSLVFISGAVNRYILISSKREAERLVAKCPAQLIQEQLWQLIEIASGFPLLSNETVQQYVPQMLNLDKISGISFTKGCYLGQETVARMQYLGKNKKMMVLLVGSAKSSIDTPISIEKQLGDNWRNAGDVLSHYLAEDGTLFIQAVVANDLSHEQSIRIKGHSDISLKLIDLPYPHNA